MAWDFLSRAAKMAWDVLYGVTKTAWDVLSGVAKNGMGCFVPGCFVLHSAICVGGHMKNMFFCMRIDIRHVKEQIFYKRWQDIWF